MKRSFDSQSVRDLLSDNTEPHAKVVLVEREHHPIGVQLVNPQAIAKKSYLDSMELSEGSSQVNTYVQANAKNKLDIIGRQMKNLQDLMMDVIEETQLNSDLHDVACNFVKKPGHCYHLYIRPSGQKYFGMLSPQEWQNTPHQYLGSYRLESDHSFTPITPNHGRFEGLNYLKSMLGVPHMEAIT